jgi:hypothetical protein
MKVPTKKENYKCNVLLSYYLKGNCFFFSETCKSDSYLLKDSWDNFYI